GSSMVDMGIAMGVMAAVMLLYGFVPSWQIIFLPLLLALTLMCATGLVLALSALTAMYRDLRFVVPFIVQAGMFLSAVPFPPDVFGANKNYLALNPIAGIIATYRTVLLGEPWEPLMLLGSVV